MSNEKADAEKVMDVITQMAAREAAKKAPGLSLGTVKSVSGGSARVVVDGDDGDCPAFVFCPGASSGKRVILARMETQLYIIGVKQT